MAFRTCLGCTPPRPGQEPIGGEHPTAADDDGYAAILFPHDAGTHSVLLVRASDDSELAMTRHSAVFDSLVWRIPVLADAVDPRRFTPLSDPQAGGGLTNTFRSQSMDGRPALPGVVLIGDAVSTTNPAAGRGISLGLRQVRELLRLLTAENDLGQVAVAFDAWCQQEVRPWFLDHVLWDAGLLRRWSGRRLDLAQPIPSDVVCARPLWCRLSLRPLRRTERWRPCRRCWTRSDPSHGTCWGRAGSLSGPRDRVGASWSPGSPPEAQPKRPLT